MQNSILSFPDRGPWGSSSWRGNASGHVYRALFEQLKPSTFADPCVGSGTSIQVAQEMGIQSWGFDLHTGWNALRDDLLTSIGQPVDLALSHPPYGAMIKYSGHVWGTAPHPDDLSHCVDDNDFNEKLHLMLLNQRRATKPGGYYGTLIGDWRRNGQYSSYQADQLCRLPASELAAVLIKTQHNCVSDRKTYGRMALPTIAHEYLILWKKAAAPVLVFLSDMVKEHTQRIEGSWKNIVRIVMMALGGSCTLERLYEAVAARAPERLKTNPNWKAKVRQVCNSNPDVFTSCARGTWSLV